MIIPSLFIRSSATSFRIDVFPDPGGPYRIIPRLYGIWFSLKIFSFSQNVFMSSRTRFE